MEKTIVSSIVLKPARPGRSNRDPADPWLQPGRVEEKIGKGKTGVTWLTRSKTRLQPVDFCFFCFFY